MMRASAGFTLFEIIIALLLVGIITAVTVPVFFGNTLAADPRTIAGELADDMRRMRNQAMAENDDRLVAFDSRSRSISINGEAARSLPPNITMTLNTAASEHLDDGIQRIRFFADGTSTGGAIVIADQRVGYRVAVDWLTGRVRIVDARAAAS